MLAEEKDLIPFTTSELPSGKWLVFSAHAYDEIFAMGGVLLRAKQQKISVTLVVMTDGQRFDNSDAHEEFSQTYKNKVQRVADFLALENCIFLAKKVQGLGLSDELISKIENIIKTENPDHVFIPSPMELHPDHRAASEVIFQAINKLSLKIDVYCYEISTQSQINLLIDTSSVIEEKKFLVSLSENQIAFDHYLNITLALDKARTYTLPIEVAYAEGFARLEIYNEGTLSEQLYKQLLPFWQTTEKGNLPLVTIIIRTKDRPELLKRAVQSVINQMYKNIELLIVNDGGCEIDRDVAAIERCLTQYRLINLKENVGRAGAANVGLKEFKGDYAMFLDDDDTIDSNHLSNLMRVIQENKVDVAYSGVGTDNGALFNYKYDKYHLYAGNYIPIHALVFSKKLIQQGCCFDENFTVYEDWDFWLQLSQKTDFYHSELVTATYFSSGDSGVGINSDPFIDYNHRLKIYKKWGGIWKPEILNSIFMSMHGMLLEKNALLDASLNLQEQQKAHLQYYSEHSKRLEQTIERNNQESDKIQAQIDGLKNHIDTLKAHNNYLQGIIVFLEKNVLLNIVQRVLSKIKQYIVKLIINQPKLRFIAYLREYIRHHPNGLSRGFTILKNKGVKPLYVRLKQLAKGDFSDSPVEINQVHICSNYQYKHPILTPSISKEIDNFKISPLISIVMPVYNIELKWLKKAIQSVNEQWYKNWELCIVDDESSNQKNLSCLQEINDNKVKIKYLHKNINISAVNNKALAIASGEYITLMEHSDEISPDALYEVVKIINSNQAEFVYSDEDKINFMGEFCAPHFKADYSPGMILSQNYISHLGVIKRELIDQVDGFSKGLDSAQDYDLYLKVLEKTDNIEHVSKVLYHWRKIPDSTSSDFAHKPYTHEVR